MSTDEYLHFSLSDFDHENERYAEIGVTIDDLRVEIERRVETNADYLRPDAEPPEDWSQEDTIFFATGEDLKVFMTELTGKLINSCFLYFDANDDSVDDSDDAVADIEERLGAIDLSLTLEGDGRVGGDELAPLLKALLDYPR